MLDQVHEELDVIGAEWDEEDLPTSVGDYFEHQFDKFLEKEQDKEKKNIKEALFRWFISCYHTSVLCRWFMQWESVDTAVEDMKQQVRHPSAAVNDTLVF